MLPNFLWWSSFYSPLGFCFIRVLKKMVLDPNMQMRSKFVYFFLGGGPHFMVIFDPSRVMLVTFEAWGTKIQWVFHQKQKKNFSARQVWLRKWHFCVFYGKNTLFWHSPKVVLPTAGDMAHSAQNATPFIGFYYFSWCMAMYILFYPILGFFPYQNCHEN